jgi:signal transduction histidine kinase
MHASALLDVYEAGEPAAALHAAAARIAETLPLRAAFWIGAEEAEVIASWPTAIQPSAELREALLHSLRAEVFPLGSEFPADFARFPAADILLLPSGPRSEGCGAVGFVAERGSFGEELDGAFSVDGSRLGEDLDDWNRLGQAFAHVAKRSLRQRAAQAECDDLRQRVEESEALHTLGLAANRTLDPEEVFPLVARFTRTLLGAHYVVVHTEAAGYPNQATSVGLRDSSEARESDFFAERVMEARTILTAGCENAALPLEDLPFHAAQGMRCGLGVPLSLFGETFGALVVGYRRPYTPTPRDTRLALTLAGHAAVAISNARLHQTVAAQSAALQAALEELQRASETKQRFFAFINHELRTPLGAVIGYHSLMTKAGAGQLPEPLARYLGNAERSAQKLLVLVNDILDLSKLAAGKMEVAIGPCSMADVVQEVLATIQPLADSRGIRVAVPPPDELPRIRTDAHRLRQILLNLLSNAVKFTDAGEVTLSTHQPENEPDSGGFCSAPEGPWLEIRVADTGSGIAPENLERIFADFEQATGADAHRGTGLGLPISRRLAHLLGGELYVQSEVGLGSTFVLRLPGSVHARTEPEAAFAEA